MRTWIKRILGFLLIIFIIACIIPYLIPLKSNNLGTTLPFKESEFTEIEGISIHYRKWLPIDTNIKGKVLMVHGFGGSTFSWRNNIDDLIQNGYMVVAVDLPGFGYSDKGSGINHSQGSRSKIVWSLLDNIDFSLETSESNFNWILIGHSMGGGTVASMAMDRPNKTSDLIFVSGALFENKPFNIPPILYFPPLRRGIDVALYDFIISQSRIENFLLSAYGRTPTTLEVEGYLEPLLVNEFPSFVADLFTTSDSEPLDKLKDTDIPILYIRGKEDTWVPLEQALKLKEIVPNVEIINIENAAHCSMETSYEEFNRILLPFIANKD